MPLCPPPPSLAQVFPTPAFKAMVKNCISQDLSWSKPATKWEGVLEEIKYGGSSSAGGKKASIVTPVQEKGRAPALV